MAKRLLKNTGVIFISIDDNEQAQLKLLCNEIFGEENFIASNVWEKIHSLKNDAKYLSVNHEYVLLYAKSIANVKLNLLDRTEDMNSRYKNPDNDERGVWQSGDLVANETRKDGNYDVVSPITGKIFNVPLGKHWVYSKDNMENLIRENSIWFGRDGNAFPRKKRFLSEVKDGRVGSTIWFSKEVGHNQEGKRELKDFFKQSEQLFSTPKPLRLLNRILELSTKPNSIVLDFFAGSGTTLHSIMELNKRDKGTRQCILVTNNERDINIARDICYERNKRVIEGYTKQNGEEVQGLSNNNLRYYKTKFVGRDRSEKNKKELTQLAVDLLKIREDCYKEFQKLKNIHIFENDIFYLIVIYSDDAILEAIELIKPLEKKVKVYVFSPSPNSFSDAFTEVQDKIDYCPLPNAIYRVYQHILPEEDKFKKPRIEDGDSELNIDGQTSLLLD